MSLEKITTQQMDAKGVCAAPDVLSGTPAQNKAVFDRMVRELIAPAYNAAVDAINEINQTENGIEAAEALRVSAENLRVAAENARAQAEGGRVTAEQARASAENLRVEAENLRKAAETARSKAESGRVTADKDRESAETTRVVNENQRIENENARIAAEHARADENTGIVAQATQKADEAAESARLAAQAMLGQIPDGSFPESKLVSELQEAIDRAKPGGEIDRTSANKASLATQQTVEKTNVPAKSVTLDASELQAYLDGLPRLLTESIDITVSGTLTFPLTISDFYGSGNLCIHGETLGSCVIQNAVSIYNCSAKVEFYYLQFEQVGTISADGLLWATKSRYVKVVDCTLTGCSGAVYGIGAKDGSTMLLCRGAVAGFQIAAFAGEASMLYVGGKSGDTPSFHDNDTGAYVWNGGVMLLLDYAPDLLGGIANLKQGGMIVKSDGTLL